MPHKSRDIIVLVRPFFMTAFFLSNILLFPISSGFCKDVSVVRFYNDINEHIDAFFSHRKYCSLS